jgi:UDP-GlcNAc:undecaprenyl-phosphate/decaprenyl-phosphate GlcNAc-1-phosphate transferase
MITLFFVSFISSLIATLIIIKTERLHHKLSHDHDLIGVQKFHELPVSRIGGLALVVGLIIGGYYFASRNDETMHFMYWAGIAAIPVFVGGLAEDFFKRVSARSRLILAFLSASIAYYELDPGLKVINWEWFDSTILALPGVSLALTLVMVGGVAHATNIIDGFNGLLNGFALLSLFVFGSISYQTGDLTLLSTIIIMAGSLSGLFLFNYPKGLIFTGDGGAYLIGFLLAIISLLILKRNPEVSPWFPLLVMIYPVFETIFSIYRKKFLRGMSPGIPDGIHLHMLIYKRVVPRFGAFARKHPNPSTSPIIWGFSLLSLVPSFFWWKETWVMILGVVVFCVVYVVFYFWIVRFGKIRRKR